MYISLWNLSWRFVLSTEQLWFENHQSNICLCFFKINVLLFFWTYTGSNFTNFFISCFAWLIDVLSVTLIFITNKVYTTRMRKRRDVFNAPLFDVFNAPLILVVNSRRTSSKYFLVFVERLKGKQKRVKKEKKEKKKKK